ncbi:MAG TPA: ABC transporter ATP-binding protein [Acidimicrobiales bacterium]|nr:ABC transporter ATP-binding protein [Acidimicrobiales bacterium]
MDRLNGHVELRDLQKSYGDIVALQQLTLTLEPRELVALVGHNGSGKSTLLRMIAGLLEPTSGEILIDDEPAGSMEARRATSYLGDTPVLYDDLSVDEHLAFIAALHGVEDAKPSADALLERLSLEERRDDLPVRFSRGMRQKTAIAIAFIRPFDLLLVDEPFVGLDPSGQEEMRVMLAEASGAATVMVATHEMSFLQVATRCIALRDGGVVYDGEPPARLELESFLD